MAELSGAMAPGDLGLIKVAFDAIGTLKYAVAAARPPYQNCNGTAGKVSPAFPQDVSCASSQPPPDESGPNYVAIA